MWRVRPNSPPRPPLYLLDNHETEIMLLHYRQLHQIKLNFSLLCTHLSERDRTRSDQPSPPGKQAAMSVKYLNDQFGLTIVLQPQFCFVFWNSTAIPCKSHIFPWVKSYPNKRNKLLVGVFISPGKRAKVLITTI